MRQTPPSAAPAAPATTPARTGRGGASKPATPEKARGFDQLVDRLAETRDDVNGPESRGARSAVTAREDVAAEARAKEPRANDRDDADTSAPPTTDAPPATTQTPFPWTLPLNPALWTLETSPGDGADADAGQQTDEATAGASIDANASLTIGTAATPNAAAALSPSAGAGSVAAPDAAVAGNAKAAEATSFKATLDANRVVDTDETSLTPEILITPAEVPADARVGATFATRVEDEAGAAASATTSEAGQSTAAPAAAADTVSLGASLSASGQGNEATPAISAGDGSSAATAAASTTTATATRTAADATASPNESTGNSSADMNASAATPASISSAAQNDTTAAAVDRARQQAMQELRRAMHRAGAAADASVGQAQGAVDGNASGEATIAIDASTATTVTDRNSATTASAAHTDVAPTAQAGENGPRAAKASEAEGPVDASAWATATAGVTPAEQASNGAGHQHGFNGRGRDAHPDNFGAAVSSLRHASDGGAQGMPPAFEARNLMAAGVNNGPDSPDIDASASAAIVTTAPPEEQAAQIVRSMRLHWRGSMGEAQLRLTPEHLGQVLVSVRVDQGSVKATMHAETPAAQQWIQAHQQQLRDALDAQGLKVAQLQVTSDPEDRPGREQAEEEPRERPKARPQEAEGKRFEVRV